MTIGVRVQYHWIFEEGSGAGRACGPVGIPGGKMMKNTRRSTADAFLLMVLLITLSVVTLPGAPMPDEAAREGVIEPGAKLVILAKGFRFTEGPAVDSGGTLYFTDIPNNLIHKWDKKSGLGIYRKDSEGANGLYFDPSGNLVICAGGGKKIVSIDRKGVVTVLAAEYDGKPFNQPNDLWVRPDGGVYFSDPVYGSGTQTQDGMHIYYISPDRRRVTRVVDDMIRPNGLIGTPDGKWLYIADAGAQKTWRYWMNTDGSLSKKTLFVESGSDGMTIDGRGNIYITGNTVHVYNPRGKRIDEIQTPARPTNLCFGGPDNKTLYITARTFLCSIQTTVPGV